MKNLFMIIASVLLLTGCETMFYGEAKIKGGTEGCETKCSNWGMELVGMVALGEYSDGCICKKKDEKLSMNSISEALLLSASGSGATAVRAHYFIQERKSALIPSVGSFH
jgi:hypothetical protein